MDPAVPPVASLLVYVQLNIYVVMSEIHILRSLFSTA